MRTQTAEPDYAGSLNAPRSAPLRGLPLIAARGTWVSVVAVALALFVFAVPAELEYLQTACTECDGPRLTLEGVQTLENLGLSTGFYAMYVLALEVGFAVVSFAVAAAIFWRKSDDAMALLGALAVLVWGITFPNTTVALAESYPAVELSGALLGFLGLVTFTVFFYIFPDGRFVPGWMRWLALALILLVAPSYFFPDSPASIGTWPAMFQIPFYLVWMGSLVAVQVYRYRSVSGSPERQQTKWVVFGFAAAIVGFLAAISVYPFLSNPGPLAYLAGNTGIYLSMMMIPLSIGVAILRYRLFDIDLVINRTLVYGALTACVVGIYILVVGYLGAVFQTDGNLLFSLIATGVVAVLFAPLRDRLQRGVNRLMYGERDDPYGVLSRLGQRLEATLVPDAVLPVIVETIQEALKLPCVAIVLKGDDLPVASSGKPVENLLRLPLMYRNELVGDLSLGTRTGEEGFSAADRLLLEDLARQAGVAAYAVRLTADLQRSRERLVATREEERRRLRRDLHDGLGAQLAGLNMQAGVLRNLIHRDPATADDLVVEMREELRAAISDIRRLVHDLRPPALDDLGLVGALERLAERYGAEGEGPRVRIEAPESDSLPPLPAAAEVAVYRIVQEALTNVARHARARNCVVRMAVNSDALKLDIADDGVGLPVDRRSGVGLVSMRERAAELGGTCSVEPVPEGGTLVSVRLPLRKE